MPAARRDPSTDLGLLLLAVIWGVNFSVVKMALDELEPLAFNALRFPLAALVMWLLLRGREGVRAPERGDVPRILILGILGNVVYQLCFIFSLDWTLAGNASLILSTTPVWTMLLSHLVGHERLSRWVTFGVGGTVVGVTLVMVGRGDTFSLASATVRGDLLMLGASLLWSIYTVGGRGAVRRYGALRMTAWTLWVATPAIVLMGVPDLLDTDWGRVSAGAWAGVTYAGVMSVGVAYVLWYRGVQRLGNNRTAVYSNLVPVAALVTAWIWLGEVPTSLQLLGAGVILTGLSVARLSPHGRARAATGPPPEPGSGA